MPGLLGRLVKGAADFVRLACFFDERADPWERVSMAVPASSFGLASEREFHRYLEGPTRVPASTIEEMCEWLRGCEAVDDLTLFHEPDFWQHPVTFEHLRKGDCEDHALWAWRHLHRLRIPGMFVAGLWNGIAHTWVLFRHNNHDHLFETTCKHGDMVHPLPRVRALYTPALGVDFTCRTYVFQGYQRFRLAAANPGGARA